MIIRPCELTDLPNITAIYRDAVLTGLASFEIEPPDEAEMTRRHAALVASGHPYLVALIDEAVAGYAYAGPYRARLAYAATVENSVYVAAAFRRRGVAAALLGAVVEAAAAAGFRQMVAVIGDRGNAASVALHRSVGFAEVGVLRSVGWKHGRWLDCVLMQLALGPGDKAPGPGGSAGQ